MAKLFNLAQMTTATAGTGTITLGSAVAPFITFAAAGVQNNDVVAYSIIDGANSEMGYGTYSAAGPTLTRNLRKSSTGALLNLSGSAIVRLTPGREDIINPDGSIAFVANLDMGSNKIINVTDPSAAQDAATKNYVDNATAGITGSHNPVTLGTANGLVLSNQVLSLDLASSTSTGSVSAADWTTFNNKQAALGFTPENVANKDIDAALAANSDTKYPSQKAVKAYIDAGLATGTHAPVTLGTANGLSLSGQQLSLGFSSGTASGALSGSDWQLFNSKQAALGFTPENVANKTQLVRSSGTSSTLYPSESAVSGFVASSIANIPAAGGNIGSFLLSGGGVTWVTGYQFRVSAAQYYIQGVLYSSAEQLITLTGSDATFDRIDVIVVNTSGQVDKVTGVANSSPSEPDIDPATQLQLAFIIVYAASSSPIIQSQTIYSEDAGSPTEWNWSSTGSTWNLASTNNPFAGTKDIEATSLGANAYAQGMATGTVNLGIYTQLNFYVRSKATWNSGRGLYVAWYSNGVRKGNNIFLAHGFFNFNSDNTTDYQLISIPISQFAVPNGTTVNQLRFTRVGGAIGFYLDEIVVTDSGLTATPVGLTQEQADARYAQFSFKTIQVSGQGDVVADAKDDTLTFVAGSGMTINTATGTDTITFASSGGGTFIGYVAQGRLSLVSGTAVPTTDQTGKSTLYYTPYSGDKIDLYDGVSSWGTVSFTQLSLALGTLTSGSNYDVFIYNNSGTATMELSAAWTNDTTRSTALIMQNGILVKSGATTRRYVGTIRTTNTTITEDSLARRFLWNYYNRVPRQLYVTDTTDSWTYATAAWQAARNTAANKVEYVVGASDVIAMAHVMVRLALAGTSTAGSVGVGVDSVVANSAQLICDLSGTNLSAQLTGDYIGYPGLGYHYLQWLEYARAGTCTFYGDGGVADIISGLFAIVDS